MKFSPEQKQVLQDFAKQNQDLLKEMAYDPFGNKKVYRTLGDFSIEISGSKFCNDICHLREVFINGYIIKYGTATGCFRCLNGVFEFQG